MTKHSFLSSLGPIELTENNNAIISLKFKMGDDSFTTPLLNEAEKEIKEYLSGERKYFTLPLNPEGTEFQKSVWNELLRIPYGETKTYKEIATLLNTKGYRAVGSACGKNPIPILIPCHRVLSFKGLGGWSGPKGFKEKLLSIEKKSKKK